MDLFADTEFKAAPKPQPRIYSVTELTREIRGVLEEGVGSVWVQGEVCNYRRQGSGHQYFALKDEKCQVPCVWFHRPYLQFRQIPLADGMAIQVRGEMTVYEARGQYQLSVNLAQPAGAGLLQARFDALKRKLEAEGLFDSARKKTLPKFPRRLGVVTSPSGAALRDLLTILERRAPWISVLIHPVKVQGDGAAAEIAAAVRDFNDPSSNELPRVDLIIVSRGGGSAEDLWAFNEESVARAVFASAIPVVSAVGHEIDFTICDFVADLRAPTPSAAAELVSPDGLELARHFAHAAGRIERCAMAAIEAGRARLSFLARGALVREPKQRLIETAQRLDGLDETIRRQMQSRIAGYKARIGTSTSVVRQHRPDQVIRLRKQELSALAQRLRDTARAAFGELQQRLSKGENLLRLLSPQGTLDRGYSITTGERGAILRSVNEVRTGEEVRTRLRDGLIDSTVQQTGSRFGEPAQREDSD